MKEFVKKLIKELEKSKKVLEGEATKEMMANGHTLDFENLNGGVGAVKYIITLVKHLAEEYGKDTNVTTNNGWIPCEKELPKENEFVISSIHPSKSVNGGNPVIISVYNSVSASYWNDGTIQAWQPLPEPYQKGE